METIHEQESDRESTFDIICKNSQNHKCGKSHICRKTIVELDFLPVHVFPKKNLINQKFKRVVLIRKKNNCEKKQQKEKL